MSRDVCGTVNNETARVNCEEDEKFHGMGVKVILGINKLVIEGSIAFERFIKSS